MSRGNPAALAAMEGNGFYNRNSSAQAAGIRSVLPLWAEVARAVEVGDGPLVIADYGSSQGRNSRAPMRVAIEALRAKAGSHRPVLVFHTDLPTNDFTSLFTTLQEDQDSYLADTASVFAAAVGRSYFDPILPAGQVHLAWNSFTLQWLSRKPIDAPDHIAAGCSAVPTIRAAAAAQAADDWRRFLGARAAELRTGGKMLCLILAATEETRFTGHLAGELWPVAVEMGRAGLLSDLELLRLTIPIYRRERAEIEAPFSDGHRFAGLRLERFEATQAPDPFWGMFTQTGDAGKFGRSWADAARAIFAPTLMGQIGLDRDPQALLNELFARLAARLAATPRRIDIELAAVVLGKLS